MVVGIGNACFWTFMLDFKSELISRHRQITQRKILKGTEIRVMLMESVYVVARGKM